MRTPSVNLYELRTGGVQSACASCINEPAYARRVFTRIAIPSEGVMVMAVVGWLGLSVFGFPYYVLGWSVYMMFLQYVLICFVVVVSGSGLRWLFLARAWGGCFCLWFAVAVSGSAFRWLFLARALGGCFWL